MEQSLDNYIRASHGLKVHKRAAGNIKEQLTIISRSFEDSNPAITEQTLRSLHASILKLEAFSRISPLQSYLRQGEITDVLDSLFESCWTFTQNRNDEILREDIEAQREIYDSDRKADSVSLRQLLRECLRRSEMHKLLVDLTGHDISALEGAVKLEISMLSSSSEAIPLYENFLSRLESLSIQETKTRGLQDLTGKIVRISNTPIAWGAICAVWTGELYGKRVTLHSPVSPTKYDLVKGDITVLENSIIWASFDHPHILSLLGIYRDFDKQGIALVSPWMENQTVAIYVRNNPGADRLKLITEMASGLVYLHSRSPPYVHGLLTASGVLVNENKSAVVGGFASATFDKGCITPLRWQAPENMDRLTFRPSIKADTYSFAMTALEIMTGETPFKDVRSPFQLIDVLNKGGRPMRPDRRLIHHGLDDKLWTLITHCWAEVPDARPTMSEVLRELEKMRELPALDVRDLTDLITLTEDGLGFSAVCARGGFGEIRLARLKSFGLVALKTLIIKSQLQPVIRLTKRFLREATIWNSLQHPNILAFLGTADLPGLETCLVSPWVQNGNCMDYLTKNPHAPIMHIAQGIARGLKYLHEHEPPVVHGDMRGANVLISDTGDPLLCDFGLAVIVEDLTKLPISSALQSAGNPRWMAPELFVGEGIVSRASDIWSLGMVLLELTTLDIPFCELKNNAQIIIAIHKGERPRRPSKSEVSGQGPSNELWALMQQCWKDNPSERPDASQVLHNLEEMAGTCSMNLERLACDLADGVNGLKM